MKRLIFVSSVQGEFAKERRAIRNFVHGSRFLGRHFEVFLFEDRSRFSRPVKLTKRRQAASPSAACKKAVA